MKASVASAAAVLLLAGAVQAQTAPPVQTPAPAPAPGADLTRDLNSGPPAAATYLAPAPAPVSSPQAVAPIPSSPAAPPVSAPITPARPSPSPRIAPLPPSPTPPRVMVPEPRAVAPTVTPAPRAAPPVAAPVATPTPRPASPAAAATPAPAPVVEPTPPPPAPDVPTVTVLDATARAALPFSVELPAGFQIVTGRPGPDFKIYTIRRGDRSFAMVYVGPASQFPIYSGEQVQAGGRTSIVATEDGQRHAMEHLFQRPDAPREVHIWTMTLDGADRALAEQIAQSIDVR